MPSACNSSRASFKLNWSLEAEDVPAEAESAAIEERLRHLPERVNQGLVPFSHIEDTNEEQNEDDVIPALANIIDLTGYGSITVQRSEALTACSSSVPLNAGVAYCEFKGTKVVPGSTVEIQALEQPQLFKASFLYITHIFSSAGGSKLLGIPLTRLKNLRGRLPRQRNELAMILHIDISDGRTEEVQGAIEVPITDVIKIRHCHFTNADYPKFRTVIGVYSSPVELAQQGVLMCRWRCIFKYRDAATRNAHISQTQRNAAPLEYVVEHIQAKQLSKRRFKVPDITRFNAWRGGKVRGGEHDPGSENGIAQGPIVQIDGEEDPELVYIAKKPGQRYTLGDMFCGAGGASCGAQKAGFQVKVACDHHPGACKTYHEVFPEAQLYELDIFEFIMSENTKTRVDVLHLSPPCQFWSPAHTCAGVNDDANIAALFSCHELIRKLRPRLFTLEQTFGILHPKFEYYFNALVNGFTTNHYSVRWKVIDLVDWGSPATRKRLIMIGSCPGEDLPPFPKATHVAPGIKRRGKKPYVTVKKMLARIPHNASQYDDMHQPHDMKRKQLARWDANVTLRRCITTNGGYGNYHPNGRRDFTLREYATLQTFPVEYPFQHPDKKKQIGNAFPPMIVKVLYTHLRKWLENQDRVYSVELEPIDPDDPSIEILDLDEGLMDEAGDDEDVEYLGSQHFSDYSGGSVSIYLDDMDLDMGDDDYVPVPCVDANQGQLRRVRQTVETTAGWTGNMYDYIDLTKDD